MPVHQPPSPVKPAGRAPLPPPPAACGPQLHPCPFRLPTPAPSWLQAQAGRARGAQVSAVWQAGGRRACQEGTGRHEAVDLHSLQATTAGRGAGPSGQCARPPAPCTAPRHLDTQSHGWGCCSCSRQRRLWQPKSRPPASLAAKHAPNSNDRVCADLALVRWSSSSAALAASSPLSLSTSACSAARAAASAPPLPWACTAWSGERRKAVEVQSTGNTTLGTTGGKHAAASTSSAAASGCVGIIVGQAPALLAWPAPRHSLAWLPWLPAPSGGSPS